MKIENRNYAPNQNRPLMMLRLRFGHEEPEIWRRTFEQIKQNRGCCDEVWFSTGIGTPCLEEHRRLSDLIASHAEDLRQIGIIPSLQIQSTIGHSDSLIESAGAEGMAWGAYVGVNGEQCQYINCPRQQGFHNYLKEMSRIYAQWKPGSVWIDDDLRLANHRPAAEGDGCYCPHCLNLFGKEIGHYFSREELVAECKINTELYIKWKEFGTRSLCIIAEIIVRNFHEISPDTRFGLQHNGDLTRVSVFETMLKNGESKPASRPGAGAYSDHLPYEIVDKAFYLSRQMFEQPGYEVLGQVCPEIESCPRDFCCKTSQGLRVESLLNLAFGTDSLSYFIMDPIYETPEWYGENLLKPLAEDANCFRDFIRHNEGSFPGGVGIPGQAILTAEMQGLPLVGIPSAAYSPYANCFLVTRRTIESLSDTDLQALLDKDIILDGSAALAVQERNMNDKIGVIKTSPLQKTVFDFYTDNCFNKGLLAAKHYPLSDRRFTFEIPERGGYTILSKYLNHKKQDFGIATLLYERPNGTRVALIGDDGFYTRYISSTRVSFLNRIADWVSHDSIPIKVQEPVQCLLTPRITENGELRSITILNTTIGKQKSFDIELRNISSKCRVEWIIPSEAPKTIEIKHIGNKKLITLPQIAPWEIGWVKLHSD